LAPASRFREHFWRRRARRRLCVCLERQLTPSRHRALSVAEPQNPSVLQAASSKANAERHLGFETFETFSRVMTRRRLELLRHVHRHPARSIRALAMALGRDYRRVHQDVEALVQAGLLDRDEGGLHADYETFRIETRVAL